MIEGFSDPISYFKREATLFIFGDSRSISSIEGSGDMLSFKVILLFSSLTLFP